MKKTQPERPKDSNPTSDGITDRSPQAPKSSPGYTAHPLRLSSSQNTGPIGSPVSDMISVFSERSHGQEIDVHRTPDRDFSSTIGTTEAGKLIQPDNSGKHLETDRKTVARRQKKWPPDSLKKYVEARIGHDPGLGSAYKDALKRLIDPDNVDLFVQYEKLSAESDSERISKYLEQVSEVYLDVEMYRPLPEKKYKDWLRKVSRTSERLANTLLEVPSPDLALPDWLSSLDSLLLLALDRHGDEIASEELRSTSGQLKRYLEKFPPSALLRVLAELAKEAASAPPRHYWEAELGIRAPRKHGRTGKLALEQIALRSIKELTQDFFGKPHHEIVAALINTLIGSDKHSAETVGKAPKSRPRKIRKE